MTKFTTKKRSINKKNKIKIKIKMQRDQRSNSQNPLDLLKSKRVPEKYISASLTMPKP